MGKKQQQSPAMTLLQLVWANMYGLNVFEKSWDRVNWAMQEALTLAIVRGFRFDADDWAAMEPFRPWCWRDTEYCYSLAVAGGYYDNRAHGINMPACLAIEKDLGRKPFLLQTDRMGHDKTRTRICVGVQFVWSGPKDKKDSAVKVTSFAKDQQSFIACSYKPVADAGDYCREKIERRYRITHDDIAAYHQRLRDFLKT